jgi:hypothetical protein
MSINTESAQYHKPHLTPFKGAGELIQTTYKLFGKHFATWMGIVLRVAGIIFLLNIITTVLSLLPLGITADPTTAGPMGLGLNVVSTCVGLLVLIVGVFLPWMNGALIYQTLERMGLRAVGVSDSYRATQPRFGALWLNAFLSQAVFVLLFLPLFLGAYSGVFAVLVNAKLIPNLPSNLTTSSFTGYLIGVAAICTPLGFISGIISLILGLMWSVTQPTIVAEGSDGFGAFSRSNKLTKGMRWALLGRFILFGVFTGLLFALPLLVLVAVSAIPFLSANAPSSFPLFTTIMLGVSAFISQIFSLFNYPLQSIFTALNYLDLRAREELAVLTPAERQQRLAAPPPTSLPQKQPQVVAPLSVQPQLAAQPIASRPIETTVTTVAPAQTALAPLPASSQLPSTAGFVPAVNVGAPMTILPNMTPAQKIGVFFTRLRNDGPNPQLLSEMGKAYYEVGDLGASLDAFSRARDMAPNNPEITLNLARVHISRKDTMAARSMIAAYFVLESNETAKRNVLTNPELKPYLP